MDAKGRIRSWLNVHGATDSSTFSFADLVDAIADFEQHFLGLPVLALTKEGTLDLDATIRNVQRDEHDICCEVCRDHRLYGSEPCKRRAELEG